MYNQDSLPLSFKKVWKKFSLRVFSPMFFLFIFILMISALFLRFKTEIGLIDPKLIFYTYLALWLSITGLAITVLFSFLYEYFYYKMYKYDFKEDDAQITKGVFTRASGHVRYAKFQNIYVDQDFWDRVFGLYDVHYETAGETSGFYSHIDGLNKDNSAKLVDFLSQKAKHSDSDSSPKKDVAEATIPKISGDTSTGTTNFAEMNRQNCPISKVLLLLDFIYYLVAYFFLLVFLTIFYFVGAFQYHTGVFSLQGTYANLLSISWLEVAVIGVGVFYVVVSWVNGFIWYRNFYFNFGRDKGEVKQGVIWRSASYLYYDRIQNININKGLLDMMFGVCSLSIETAGELSSLSLSIPALKYADAENLRNFLLQKAKNYKGRI